MPGRRVLHLVGSGVSTGWDELSRLYAGGALAALADNGDEHRLARVEPDGRWSFPDGLSAEALDAATRYAPGAGIDRLTGLGIDLMVPHLFCLPGMTRYRALFDVLGIPYVGNAPEVMWLGARKDLARAAVAAAGVTVPAGELVRHGTAPSLRPPFVVKPVAADNSDGVTLVGSAEEVEPALAGAFTHGDEVLVEAFVPPGREVRCGVLEERGVLRALPLEEYPIGPAAPIRTGADKLGRDAAGALALMAKGNGRAWIVPQEDPATAAVGAAARLAHRALGCRHYSLFDFRIDPAGRPHFLEAGLYCSFSRQSVVATMAAAAGLDVVELFDRMAVEALAPSPRSERSVA